MLKIVADTNIFISALCFGGEADKVLSIIRKEKYKLFISSFILKEIKGVLENKFKWDNQKLNSVIKQIRFRSRLIAPKIKISKIKNDDTDNRILECAAECGANYIVSGDKKHLLPLKLYNNINIISPAEFIKLYNSNSL